jgi:hypothetical protein
MSNPITTRLMLRHIPEDTDEMDIRNLPGWTVKSSWKARTDHRGPVRLELRGADGEISVGVILISREGLEFFALSSPGTDKSGAA